MGNFVMYTYQTWSSGMIIDDRPPEYDYNTTSSFSVTFKDQYDKFPLDKVGPIKKFQIEYPIHK